MTTKVCTKCGVEKDVGEFNMCSSKSDGLQSNCKECKRAQYIMNRPKRLEQVRVWREENPDRCRANDRNKVASNPALYAEIRLRHRAANREDYSKRERTSNARGREELRDWYVLSLFRREVAADIPQPLINLKREQLALHRVISKAKKLLKEKP